MRYHSLLIENLCIAVECALPSKSFQYVHTVPVPRRYIQHYFACKFQCEYFASKSFHIHQIQFQSKFYEYYLVYIFCVAYRGKLCWSKNESQPFSSFHVVNLFMYEFCKCRQSDWNARLPWQHSNAFIDFHKVSPHTRTQNAFNGKIRKIVLKFRPR